MKTALAKGLSLNAVTAKTGVPKSTVWNWSRLQKYRAPGAKPLMVPTDERKFVQSLRTSEARNHPITSVHAGKLAASARKILQKLSAFSWLVSQRFQAQ